MIRREEADSTWLVHQAAHAYVAGQIADHWAGSGALTVAPRDETVLAAYTHDSGWFLAEQQPSLNRYGQPRTFTEMDLDDHFTIWCNSITATASQNRYTGLLTSLHCSALYEQRLRYVDDPPDAAARIRAFVDQRHAWENAQIAALSDHPRYGEAVQPARLALNLRLLQVWDYISLLVCMGPVAEQELEDIPMAATERAVLKAAPHGPRGIALDPFPLNAPLSLSIDARDITGKTFESDAAFRQEAAQIAYQSLTLEIAPLQGAAGEARA